jgi:hypothetical protein
MTPHFATSTEAEGQFVDPKLRVLILSIESKVLFFSAQDRGRFLGR